MTDRTERYVCTKDAPWTPEKGERANHPDAESMGDRDFGDGEVCEKWRCPNCGETFYVELPQ